MKKIIISFVSGLLVALIAFVFIIPDSNPLEFDYIIPDTIYKDTEYDLRFTVKNDSFTFKKIKIINYGFSILIDDQTMSTSMAVSTFYLWPYQQMTYNEKMYFSEAGIQTIRFIYNYTINGNQYHHVYDYPVNVI